MYFSPVKSQLTCAGAITSEMTCPCGFSKHYQQTNTARWRRRRLNKNYALRRFCYSSFHNVSSVPSDRCHSCNIFCGSQWGVLRGFLICSKMIYLRSENFFVGRLTIRNKYWKGFKSASLSSLNDRFVVDSTTRFENIVCCLFSNVDYRLSNFSMASYVNFSIICLTFSLKPKPLVMNEALH